MPPSNKAPTTTQVQLNVEVIKQYSGVVASQRRVKVMVPGKFFNNLTPAEAKQLYEGETVDHVGRHKFNAHAKAWGAAHTGPAIRFLCSADTLDDPDHKGFYTPLSLFNRWRHDTYKNDREKELQYLDALPAQQPTASPTEAAVKKEPAVKEYFNHPGPHGDPHVSIYMAPYLCACIPAHACLPMHMHNYPCP
jgi:hypothetical protein